MPFVSGFEHSFFVSEAAEERTKNGSSHLLPETPSSVVQQIVGLAEWIGEAVAVESAVQSFTYAELERLSRRIAIALVRAGYSSSRIAVLCERSAWTPVYSLGVFRSGSVYIPLDISTPEKRLGQIVADAEPAAIITDQFSASVAERLAEQGIPNLTLEMLLQANDQHDSIALPEVSGQSVAYMIYTSGSTGTPKGVEIEHGGLANFAHALAQELGLGPTQRVLAMASVAFDVSLFETIMPLYAGACVVILPRGIAGRPEELISALQTWQPKVMAATSTTWQLLRDAGWCGREDLICISGAEALGVRLAHFLAQTNAAVWNHYGPTETTIAATTYRVVGDERQIPLGLPIRGYEMMIVDDAGSPVAIGKPGELLIAGRGLARGYWKQPAKTAERFVLMPDLDGQDKRYYRTGDLVCEDESGNLIFLGRTDNQVKIRGFRLELEEVESVLQQHEAISKAAVICKNFGNGDERLVAFLIFRDGAGVNTDEVRQFLRGRLPTYMVPSLLIPRESLPIGLTGKVDRKMLQELTLPQNSLPHASEHVPADPLERKLLHVWRKLPGFEQASETDDFFSLGGHSVLAANLIAKVNRALQVRLPLCVLFEAPTVRELAVHIRTGREVHLSNLVPIRAEGSKTPLICVHGIEGNVLGFERLGVYLRRNRAIYALQAPGLMTCQVSPFTLQSLAEEYLRQVRTVRPHGPYLFGGYSSGGLIAFEMARLAIAQGDRVEKLLLFDAPMLATVHGQVNRSANRRRQLRRLRVFLRKKLPYQWKAFRRNSAIAWNVWLQKKRQRIGFALPPFRTFLSAFAFAMESYQAKPVSVQGILIRPERSIASQENDPTLGWQPYLDSVVVKACEGVHADMFFDPHAESLCKMIDELISSSESGQRVQVKE